MSKVLQRTKSRGGDFGNITLHERVTTANQGLKVQALAMCKHWLQFLCDE
jgi:hypothetical protein